MDAAPLKPRRLSGMILISCLLLAALAAAVFWLAGTRQGLDTVYATAARKAQLVADMRASLYAAAEAEKSAVLAETDQESQAFADKARADVGTVASGLAAFLALGDASATQTDQVRRFETAFAEYRKVDEEILTLAVQNTNLKALALSFGRAASSLAELEQALRPLLDGPGDRQARQAQRALAEALRIQTLHAPHIMEKTDPRMDALEKDMAAADKAVRKALGSLGAEQPAARALAAYERYWKLTSEILGLSRQNTNVRSLALSLERKTRTLAACDEALREMEQTVRERMVFKATR